MLNGGGEAEAISDEVAACPPKKKRKVAKKQETQVRVFAWRISIPKTETLADIKPRIHTVKNWCETMWNHHMVQLEDSYLTKTPEEVAALKDNHNLHFQGLGRCDKKNRPSAVLKVMLEKFPGLSVYCKPASAEGIHALKNYCMKKESRVMGPWSDTTIYMGQDLISKSDMVGFQKWVLELLDKKPSKRLTYWFYNPDGGAGKSALAKYLAYHHGVPTYTFAKAWDLLKLVSMEPNKKMYIINLSKTKPAEVCMDDLYNVLESIKDGNFCSYKGTDVKRILMNPPHIIVFANEPPTLSAMTQKRLKVFKIQALPDRFLNDVEDEPALMEGMGLMTDDQVREANLDFVGDTPDQATHFASVFGAKKVKT